MLSLLYFKILFVLLTPFFVFASSEFRVKSTAYFVEGVVLDEKFFPVPNIRVIVSTGGNAITNFKGEFKIKIETYPYDIVLIDSANSIGVLYQNLTILNPELRLFGAEIPREINSEVIRVDFAPIPAGKSAIIKFLSEEIFYSPDVQASAGERSKLLQVSWPSYINTINGRVIYLEKSQTRFEKLGEKAISISRGFYPQNIFFDTLSFYNTPGESTITIYFPSGTYEKKELSIYADFLSLHRNAGMLLNKTEGDLITASILVPLNLQLGYRLRVKGKMTLKGGAYIENFEYTYPNSTLTISREEPPFLITPQNRFSFVNNNTLFSYEWGSGSGIYIIKFHGFNPVGDFYIVTLDRTIKSPVAKSFGILKGSEFSWQVMKYLPYISVDDFVKPRMFANDLGYKAILYSELWVFNTVR
ncbi:MAG: hypothetical protein N2490_04180 [Ignavibacteria bacterium]|nr:hypothetical protein [Ignavibacteria bacterium]